MLKIGYARSIEKQRNLVKASMKLQAAFIAIMTVFASIYFSFYGALSVLIGGVSAFIPNTFFAFYVFRYRGAKAAKKTVGSFYFAEALKFILVFCLLIISYSLAEQTLLFGAEGVLVGFAVVFFSVLFIPLITKKL